MSNGCAGDRRVTRDHNGTHAQSLQRTDELRRILAWGIAHRDKADKAQRIWRSVSNSNHAMPLLGEACHQRPGFADRLCQLRNDFKSTFDDTALYSILAHNKGFGALRRWIKRKKPWEPLYRAMSSSSGGGANGHVDWVLICLRACQCGQRQHVLAIEAGQCDNFY